MQISQSLNYKGLASEILDTNEDVNLTDLLSSIPSSAVIRVASYINSKLHRNHNNFDLQIELLKIFSNKNPYQVNKLINSLQASEKHLYPFTTLACNQLIQYVFVNNVRGEVDDLDAEYEMRILIAFFHLNDLFDEEHVKRSQDTRKLSDAFYPYRHFMPSQLGTFDFYQDKNFKIQIVKAIQLFKFLESDIDLNKYLADFLAKRRFQNWKDYLKEIFSLYFHLFESVSSEFKSEIVLESNNETLRAFLVSLSINEANFSSLSDAQKKDFRPLREKPLFQLSELRFTVLNLDFFLDKIYAGVKFDIISDIPEKKIKEKIFKEFQNKTTKDFSEQLLFTETLKTCFSNTKGFSLPGQIKGKEYSDYYFHDFENKVLYLIEFKDTIIDAKTKLAITYDEIVIGLKYKMLKEEEGREIGLGQLVKVIESICEKDFNYDPHISLDSKAETTVYPIIVFTDRTYNFDGINDLLAQEFRIALKPNHCFKEVKEPVLIDLDFFIAYQNVIKDKYPLAKLIESYYIELNKRYAEYKQSQLGYKLSIGMTYEEEKLKELTNSALSCYPCFKLVIESIISKEGISDPENDIYPEYITQIFENENS